MSSRNSYWSAIGYHSLKLLLHIQSIDYVTKDIGALCLTLFHSFSSSNRRLRTVVNCDWTNFLPLAFSLWKFLLCVVGLLKRQARHWPCLHRETNEATHRTRPGEHRRSLSILWRARPKLVVEEEYCLITTTWAKMIFLH